MKRPHSYIRTCGNRSSCLKMRTPPRRRDSHAPEWLSSLCSFSVSIHISGCWILSSHSMYKYWNDAHSHLHISCHFHFPSCARNRAAHCSLWIDLEKERGGGGWETGTHQWGSWRQPDMHKSFDCVCDLFKSVTASIDSTWDTLYSGTFTHCGSDEQNDKTAALELVASWLSTMICWTTRFALVSSVFRASLWATKQSSSPHTRHYPTTSEWKQIAKLEQYLIGRCYN